MTDPNCAYCAEGALVDEFGIRIAELPASRVYLFREQSHRGRVIVASRHHVSEMIDLADADRRAFMDDVAKVAAALRRAFAPKKINYGAYGDTGCHLHFHLVPKYADDEFEWGGTFAMNPRRKFLTEPEYADLIARIRAELYVGDAAFDYRKAMLAMRRDIEADGAIDFNESTILLTALAPLADDDARVAEVVKVLREVREDRTVTPEESARIIALFDRLLDR